MSDSWRGEAVPVQQTKACAACAQQIGAGAYICPNCKEYQAPWRNELKYWAGVAALIVLISSGFAFSVGFLKLALDYFCPRRLTIYDINTSGSISLSNSSGQNVFVRHLRIKSQDDHDDLLWEIASVVEANDAVVKELVPIAAANFRGPSKKYFGEKQETYAPKLDPTKVQNVLKGWRQDFVPVFLYREGPEHKRVVSYLKDDLTTLNCTAVLSYRYLQSGRDVDAAVPCVSFLKNRTQQAHGEGE